MGDVWLVGVEEKISSLRLMLLLPPRGVKFWENLQRQFARTFFFFVVSVDQNMEDVAVRSGGGSGGIVVIKKKRETKHDGGCEYSGAAWRAQKVDSFMHAQARLLGVRSALRTPVDLFTVGSFAACSSVRCIRSDGMCLDLCPPPD